MEKTFALRPIGRVRCEAENFFLELSPFYAAALRGLEGFSHVQVLWWAGEADTDEGRALLGAGQPYRDGPREMGIFATRSPFRPNPIGLTTARVLAIDLPQGRLQLDYLDAFDATPLLDIKPYTPSLDRVESPALPAWCAHWPQSVESSADFDWASVFNF